MISTELLSGTKPLLVETLHHNIFGRLQNSSCDHLLTIKSHFFYPLVHISFLSATPPSLSLPLCVDQVNLVSEHIWCKDFLVRSFYLKNVQTQETRTLTQFHLLSWPADGIPTSTRPLLDFRR